MLQKRQFFFIYYFSLPHRQELFPDLLIEGDRINLQGLKSGEEKASLLFCYGKSDTGIL
jgi:hypothetical protein